MNFEKIQQENEELKGLVKEGKKIFTFLNEVLGLESVAKSNFLLAKLPTIITKVQRNPEIFTDLVGYLDKLKKYDVDNETN